MKAVTKEQLAEMLNGKDDFIRGTLAMATNNNLVAIVGFYDDGVEVIGNVDYVPFVDMDFAILLKDEKFMCDDGSKFRYVADRNMILPLSDEYNNDNHPRLIRVEQYPIGTSLTWRVTSNIAHAKFTIYECGEPYSEGIVIDLDEVQPINQ